ncbi:hypothetical protein [Dyella choica]|uniref:DUF839 domain-containing protein n=1 Tax=Dyella choica TaxID=1927959 RepID=A0A432M927_9GAMM|nr:hypothetical protein [Dyella choica]RUL77570.1 hypothetical protein EKH80_06735 [Dyella choica]
MKTRLLIAVAVMAFTTCAMGATPTTLKLQRGGTTVPTTTAVGGAPLTNLELDPAMTGGDTHDAPLGQGLGLGAQPLVNRSIAHGHAGSNRMGSATRTKSNPQLLGGFNGLDFYDTRFANGGNQFSVEPPDQGLCAGNGFVMESVNDVLSIYDRAGNKLVGPVDLNTFYGYPAAINRSTLEYGPELTDPSCYFDESTQRWFQLILTLDNIGTTSSFAGTNHLDLAVSQTSDPTGGWIIYKLPVQNNGTQGTPNHGCPSGFCLGDYPHMGADANAIYLTTNEFDFFGSAFIGAQIYVVSKHALASGAASANVVLFNTGSPLVSVVGFAVMPARSSGGHFVSLHGGTEYLLSSDAVFSSQGTSNNIWMWSVSNTRAIDTMPQNLRLNFSLVTVQPYAVPTSMAQQKAGSTPLLDCFATSCAPTFLGYPTNVYPGPRALGVNDSRMEQVSFANGMLWGTLDTDVLLADSSHGSGINYFAINPNSGVVSVNDTLSLPDANLTYGAAAVTQRGNGVIAFTVVGPNEYPSAGYAGLDAKVGAGPVHIAAAGVGPWDGFTGIPFFGSGPRWGDYGAAVVDGTRIWIASEFIAQTCTLTEYLTAPIGQCGGTRGSLGNWGTRISAISP